MRTLSLQPNELVQLMQGKGIRVAIMLINLLLVVWIAWLLATLTLDLFTGDESVTDTEVAVVAPAAVKQDPHQVLVRQMPDWHLMGEASVDTAPAQPVVPVNAPETHLKLTLHGAFASDDPDYARAIIADPQGQEEMYAIGDQVPGDAELREIKEDRVILMRGGRFETLSLPELRESSGRSATVRPVASAGSVKRLQKIRQTLKRNPKSLYGLIKTTPYKDESGAMIGYTINPGRDPSLFDQMGMQPNDIVTHINEVPLTNLSGGIRALKSAQSGENVTLTIIRGDPNSGPQKLSLNVPE